MSNKIYDDPCCQSEYGVPGDRCDVTGILLELEDQVIDIIQIKEQNKALSRAVNHAVIGVEVKIKVWLHAPDYHNFIISCSSMIFASLDRVSLALVAKRNHDATFGLYTLRLERAINALRNLVTNIVAGKVSAEETEYHG